MSSTADIICRPRAMTAAQRAALRAEEAARRQARLSRTKPEAKGLTLGPVVLGLFMFCILCNCLFYFYHQTKVMLEPAYMARMQQAVTGHDAGPAASVKTAASDPVAAPTRQLGQPVAAVPVESLAWHKVAEGDDVDYLRIALRIGFAGHDTKNVKWVNPANGHRGLVTPLSSSQPADITQASCHRFHITRTSAVGPLSDNVDFCADGVIREAAAN